MTTIYVSRDASAEAYARVQQLANDTPLRNINFNGAHIGVRRDDFTWVDGSSDENSWQQLLMSVYNIIESTDA